MISSHHRNTNIHYIYWGSSGFGFDLVRGGLIRLGLLQSTSYELASLWKRLIAELGGTQNGGVVVHYTHSLGTAVTYYAKHLLTKEEEELIRVISFGAAKIIPGDCFQSVINIIHTRDGVPPFLSPIAFFLALIYDYDHIAFFHKQCYVANRS